MGFITKKKVISLSLSKLDKASAKPFFGFLSIVTLLTYSIWLLVVEFDVKKYWPNFVVLKFPSL